MISFPKVSSQNPCMQAKPQYVQKLRDERLAATDAVDTRALAKFCRCNLVVRYAMRRIKLQWRSWLRHCATRRKVTGSSPDGVILSVALWPWGRLSQQSFRKLFDINVTWKYILHMLTSNFGFVFTNFVLPYSI